MPTITSPHLPLRVRSYRPFRLTPPMIPTIHLNIRSRRFGRPVITDTSFSNFIHTSYFTSSSSSSAFCSFFQQPDSLKRTSAVSAPRASPAPLYEFISPRHVPPAAIYDASPKDKTPFPFTKYIRPVICSQHKGLMGARMLKWAFGLVARAFRFDSQSTSSLCSKGRAGLTRLL